MRQPMRLRGEARVWVAAKAARAAAERASADETVVEKVRGKVAIADKELICKQP